MWLLLLLGLGLGRADGPHAAQRLDAAVAVVLGVQGQLLLLLLLLKGLLLVGRGDAHRQQRHLQLG
jgi:hypothetical protein